MSNINTGPGFSNVQNSPTIAQPATAATAQKIKFNKNYLLSLPGILRILIIMFQFAGWVSAAAVLKCALIPDDFMATRDGYLFFSIVGFLLAIVIFVLHVINIVNVSFCGKLPWTLIVFATDVLWIIPTFVLGIVAAVREGNAKAVNEFAINFSGPACISIGAFGSAAFFAFLLTIIYGVDAGYHLFKIVRGGISSPPAYTP